MDRMRWGRLVPPLVALAALVVATWVRPEAVGAADPPWDAPPCPVAATSDGAGSAGGVLGRVAGRVALAGGSAGVAWFRLDGELDTRATLRGWRLSSGDAAAGTRRRLDLPPESFASGPFGNVVLVGTDDGRSSALRAVDPVAGCAIAIATSPQVVRSALLTPSGDAVIEHRVDRLTRADLGVWERRLDGTSPRRILPGIAIDPAYGPTFATELAWGTDGRLAVVSCGEVRCRARVVDPATGGVAAVTDVGQLVGLSGDTLVVQRSCAGLPCAVEAIRLATGSRRIVVDEAGLAALGGPARDRVVWEATDGSGTYLHVTSLATGETVELGVLPAGYLPQTSAARSGSGLAVTPGHVAVVPGGRVPLDVGRGRGHAIDPLTGAAASLRRLDR